MLLQLTPLIVVNSPVATSSLITVPEVPFYSQFKDISTPSRRTTACGVTSLAMVIDYYTDATPPNTLLKQGLTSGAYINGVGWSHQGLINLSKKYGFTGKAYDYSKSPSATAYEKFTKQLSDGPVIASIHYKFDPKSTIPHLVVINGIKDGVVYYNDPAAKVGNQHISVTAFLKGWKQRYIVVRPA